MSTCNLLVDALALSENQNKFLLEHPDFRPVVCPEDRPYYSGEGGCIACDEKFELFNVNTLACETCKSGEIYHPKKRACKPINPIYLVDLEAENLLIPEGVTLDQIREKQLQFLREHPGKGGRCPEPKFTPHVCPPGRPFFNGETCIPCDQPTPYFSVADMKCAACPPESEYVAKLKQCRGLTKTTRYYTNLKGLKYIMACDDIKLQDIEKEIQNEREAAKDQPLLVLKECPEDRPFSTGSKCVACGGDTPYFDICKKQCVSCGEGEEWDSTTQTCNMIQGGFYTDFSDRNLIVTGDKDFNTVVE